MPVSVCVSCVCVCVHACVCACVCMLETSVHLCVLSHVICIPYVSTCLVMCVVESTMKT